MSQFYENFNATWIIKNYSSFHIENSDIIRSPLFTAENIDGTEWQIGKFIESYYPPECVSLQLCRCRKGNTERAATLDFEMELCNSENEVLCVTEKKKGIQFVAGDVYIFPKVITVEQLMKIVKKTSTDSLIVRCRMGATVERENSLQSLSKSCTIQTTKILNESSFVGEVDYSSSTNWSRKLTFSIDKSEDVDVKIEAPHGGLVIDISQGDKVTFRKIKCKMTLLDHKGTERVSNSGFFSFYKKLRNWNYSTCIKNSILRQEHIQVLHLKFKFTFSIETSLVEYSEKTKNLTLPSSPKDFKNTPTVKSLTEDLRKMLFSKEHADASFCVDSEVICAHKFILASRSPVFSAMFHQQMAESETGVIHISDMDVQTLKLFLEFVYTGEMEDSDWERMLELLLAADKYQVSSLKEKCSQFLRHHLSIDNVCDVVSVADIMCEHTLKVAAMDYIKRNVSKVFSSSKWSELTDKNAKLCTEIFCNFSEDLKQAK